METSEREAAFETNRASGWEDEYYQYRRDWVELPKTHTVRDYPLLVDIELVSTCNLKCPMCFTITDEFKKLVNTGFMDWDLFTRIVDEIAGKVPAVRLSLRGESTLHKKFIDAIQYCKDKGIGEVSFLTNGSKLRPAYFEKILKAGADWITISIDGMDEQYEKIRRPLKFADTLEKLKNIQALKDELGVKKPVIKIQGIWPAIKEDPERYYNTLAPYTDLIAFNPIIDYLGNDSDIEYEDSFSCPQLYQRLLIGADGKAMMCSNDEINSVFIGDANDNSIHEIWHGDKLNAIRNFHKEKDGFKCISACKHCYLPRKTHDDEKGCVNGREFIIKNYVNRSQVIGT